ncbi:serine/threonine-protein kinase DCLK3 [Tachyglossus aculeatus]|uniref:serine/threonine-protein kinase DCLK3 n=1 Tax=Tachyglossus aculeatus TaxID=9261 RepID=UPI0018F6F73E|nr:serine/threonine-protein kinase DCLK3 [Tachyglossus aculeatus]
MIHFRQYPTETLKLFCIIEFLKQFLANIIYGNFQHDFKLNNLPVVCAANFFYKPDQFSQILTNIASCPSKSVFFWESGLSPRGPLNPPSKDVASRMSERQLHGPCPPAGRDHFEKPILGPPSLASPRPNPQNGFHPLYTQNSPTKPHVITVVKPGGPTPRKVTLLLNRKSGATFERLIADISEALGFPPGKNDRVRKLYNLKGKEVRSISDFFREGDAFIAVGGEQLTLKNIQAAIEELYSITPRALASTQKSSELSLELKSRLGSKVQKADRPCGESPITKGRCEAVVPKQEGKANGGVMRPEDEVSPQKKWGRERGEREKDGKPLRKAREEESHLTREKQHGSEMATEPGQVTRCEKCKHEGSLRQTLQRKGLTELALGNNQLESGKGRSCRNVGRMGKMRSFKGPHKEGSLDGKEITWKKDLGDSSWRSGPSTPSQEPEKSKWNLERKEQRDPEIHGNNPGASLSVRREDPGEQWNPEGSLRGRQKDVRSPPRSEPSGWLGREGWEPEKPSVGRREEEEKMGKAKEKRGEAGKRVTQGESEHGRADQRWESKAGTEGKSQGMEGKKPRPCGTRKADVERYYEIGRNIGDGNFAVVKECRHLVTKQAYAMKIIDKSKLKGREGMVDSEIVIIQSLSHPNIVSLHEVYETGTKIYLILEYVQGGDLFDAILESVKFTEHDAALMLTDLCEALVHMHDKNIVHRDLKPENLLVQRNADKSTTLKLADFGLAKYVVKPIFTVCGTPTYVAPEILAEKGYGLEVDMWAAGVVLYILLCGFPPFRSQERDQDQLFNIIQQGQFEFLSPYWDNISEAAKDLVSRLLVVDPQKRYSAHRVLQHPWIQTAGKANSVDLHREVTTNIERHFRSQPKHDRGGNT